VSFSYPVYLRLTGRRCLVIGSGAEAESKIRGLREAGAAVESRPDYEDGCLEGWYLVIAALADRTVNARIFEEAERRGILFNAADDPAHCAFILPAIHRQGDLTVAVSSGGTSPAVAQRLRDWIACEAGPEYSKLLQLLGELRPEVALRYPGFEERRRVWAKIAQSEALDLFRRGQTEAAQQLVRNLVERSA
jgi:siroheme synthase-like protein